MVKQKQRMPRELNPMTQRCPLVCLNNHPSCPLSLHITIYSQHMYVGTVLPQHCLTLSQRCPTLSQWVCAGWEGMTTNCWYLDLNPGCSCDRQRHTVSAHQTLLSRTFVKFLKGTIWIFRCTRYTYTHSSLKFIKHMFRKLQWGNRNNRNVSSLRH